eukprot:scaffold1522_cov340-Prasinococcus_capsulatus_cf.AAC.10
MRRCYVELRGSPRHRACDCHRRDCGCRCGCAAGAQHRARCALVSPHSLRPSRRAPWVHAQGGRRPSGSPRGTRRCPLQRPPRHVPQPCSSPTVSRGARGTGVNVAGRWCPGTKVGEAAALGGNSRGPRPRVQCGNGALPSQRPRMVAPAACKSLLR